MRSKEKKLLIFLSTVNLVMTVKTLCFSQWMLTTTTTTKRKGKKNYSGGEANRKCRSLKMSTSFQTHN